MHAPTIATAEAVRGNGHGIVPTYRDPGEPPPWLDEDGDDLSLPWPVAPQPARRAQPTPQTQPQPAPARRLTLHSASEAWEPLPPRQWVIERLIGAGDVVLLFGDAGVGKTWLFTDLAVCVATGDPWLEKSTPGAPVLIVDEESGHRRLTDRLGRVMRGHAIAPGTPVAVHYSILAGVNLLTDPDVWSDELAAAIANTGARLLILDALSDIMLTGNENAVEDTQPVFHALRQLAERAGCAVIVVHHNNKAGGYRGSTAIPGAVDLALQVTRTDTGALRVESTKARDIEPVAFTCQPTWDIVTNTFRLEVATAQPARPQYSRGERYVLRFLAEHPTGAPKAEIESHADTCSAGTAKNALYLLADKHLIARTDAGGRESAATFALTAAGRRAAESLT